MKKIALILILFVFSTFISAEAVGRRYNTPTVKYIQPKSQSVVDITGKNSITFMWKRLPRPANGRENYKFELFKDYGYDRIINEILEHDVDSVEIPADKFENGQTYTWQVKQRDQKTRVWSMDKRWSFTVKK